MKVLITGITGFAGSHLAEYAQSQGVEVYGTKRWRSTEEFLHPEIEVWECDLRDALAIRTVIKRVQPDKVFHLAAQSFVGSSFSAPWETLQTNIGGQLHLLEAVREFSPDTKVLVCGSSEEYGLVYANELPITESQPLRPLSPYGVSKVAQDMLGYQYAQSYGLHIVRTRAFNHEGPRRGNVFAPSAFARQIARDDAIEVKVGDLSAIRDFTDVRDMVRAYWSAIDLHPDVYNIGSGEGWAISEVLEALMEISGKNLPLTIDPARVRPSDVPVLVADATKFRKLTGWAPEIPLKQTWTDLLSYWELRSPAGYPASSSAPR